MKNKEKMEDDAREIEVSKKLEAQLQDFVSSADIAIPKHLLEQAASDIDVAKCVEQIVECAVNHGGEQYLAIAINRVTGTNSASVSCTSIFALLSNMVLFGLSKVPPNQLLPVINMLTERDNLVESPVEIAVEYEDALTAIVDSPDNENIDYLIIVWDAVKHNVVVRSKVSDVLVYALMGRIVTSIYNELISGHVDALMKENVELKKQLESM